MPVAGEVAPIRSLRVLVAEDDAIIALLIEAVLEGLGHSVCASEGTQVDAVAAAVRCRPDLMIIDAFLGEGSGVAAVGEVLRAGFVPHVFISGDAPTVQALKLRAVVLEKPFSEPGLAQAIRDALCAATPSWAGGSLAAGTAFLKQSPAPEPPRSADVAG